jgi:hypothetical protein
MLSNLGGVGLEKKQSSASAISSERDWIQQSKVVTSLVCLTI